MNKKIAVVVLMATLFALTLFANAQDDDVAAFEQAEQGVTSNADWTPIIREFEGVEMVLVPAGSFMMGNTDEQFEEAVQQCVDSRTWPPDLEGCLSIASMTHSVHEQRFDEPFWIDRFEVTNDQYGEAATGLGSFGSIDQCATFSSEPNQPRNCVTWLDAQQFCESRGMRLPTEREWEYAARGPDNLVYPWGNEFIAENVVNIGTSGMLHTSEVGSIPEGASWVGAMDMSGNIVEWVSTIWVITSNPNPSWDVSPTEEEFSYPYDSEDGREDLDRTDTRRVLRGGGFYQPQPYFLRSNSRAGNPQLIKSSSFGFRCAGSYD